MTIRDITKNGVLLARHIPGDAWTSNLSFFSNDSDFLQVGTWVYGTGRQLAAHRHNIVERSVNRTQEAIFVRKGRLTASIYDEDDALVERVELRGGDLLVLLAGGHGYLIQEDGTQVLEIKNGPYPGAEIDRVRLTNPQ